MKKALSAISITILAFFFSFEATANQASFYFLESNLKVSPQDKKSENTRPFSQPESKRGDVRPSLRSEFKKIKARKRDGLQGSVKFIHEQFATFIYRGGDFEREEQQTGTQVGRKIIYNVAGDKILDRTIRRCGVPAPVKYIYDDRGFLSEVINFKNFKRDDQTIRSRITYHYDDEGKLIESYAYDNEGKLLGRDIYKYQFDKYGNWVVQIPVSAEHPLSTGERTYGKYREIIYYR